MNPADAIRVAREVRGYSQQEVATALGISQQAVAGWETGDTTPHLTKLVALARFYGTSLDEIVLGPAHTPPGAEAVRRLKRQIADVLAGRFPVEG